MMMQEPAVPGAEHYREIAGKLREAAGSCRFAGACPGYRKDHVVPLACHGPDAVSNMQWQTIRAAGKGQVGVEGVRSIGGDYRRCPVTTISISRLPHFEQLSRACQSMTMVSAP
jgi:hypothetical protein